MTRISNKASHLMSATALSAVLCAAFTPAQAGLLGGGGGAVRLGGNGQFAGQLGATATTPDGSALRGVSGSARHKATDAAAQTKEKGVAAGNAAASRLPDAPSSATTHADKAGQVSASTNGASTSAITSVQGGADAKR
ncbi:MAG: hypothetical protein ABI702_24255 [Burkholderiales bacterium]